MRRRLPPFSPAQDAPPPGKRSRLRWRLRSTNPAGAKAAPRLALAPPINSIDVRDVSLAAINRVRLGDVPISAVSFRQAVDLIVGWVGRAPFRLVVTPNVDHIITLQENAEFRQVYERAALSLADGMPVLWAARYLGLPPLEKVSGSDLLPALCARGAGEKWRAFFVGGHSPEELRQCLGLLRARYPGMTLEGHCPPPGFERSPELSEALLRAIESFRPGIIFMGVGAPKSEIWLARHADRLGVGVGIGVGAGLRMLVGLDRRAPRWMQRVGLEWSWRLLQDPVRLWRRYLVRDMRFFPLVMRWKRRAGG